MHILHSYNIKTILYIPILPDGPGPKLPVILGHVTVTGNFAPEPFRKTRTLIPGP